jgi:hypothetical protein
LLRADTVAQLGTELRVSAEQLADSAKASLQRKLNSIYDNQAKRLNQKILELERQVKQGTPEFQQQLKELKAKLADVIADQRKWLNEPEQLLKKLTSHFNERVARESRQACKKVVSLTKTAIDDLEKQIDLLVQNRFHDLLLDVVREYVSSASLQRTELTNKQLAAAKGISLREAKRIRRATNAATASIETSASPPPVGKLRGTSRPSPASRDIPPLTSGKA